MNRVLGHCLAGVSVIAGAIALTSACVHDDSSFFVQAVIFPTPQGIGTECIYTNNPSQTFLSSGLLDTAFRNQYTAWFLLADQLVTQSNPNQVQTETSDINVEGAIVRNTDAAGNQLDSYTSLTSGTLYAAVGGTPGYAAISATVVSQKAVAAAGALSPGSSKTVVAYIKFFGKTLGGDYIESNEFEFPVQVCTGCLVTFSQGDINTCFENVNCLGAASGSGSTTASTVPCVPGQDTPIDCSQCPEYGVCNPSPGKYICASDAGPG